MLRTLIIVAIVVSGCSTSTQKPQQPAKQTRQALAIPAEEEKKLPIKELSAEEMQVAWVQDVYHELSGALLHNEGHPKSMLIGGVKWARTNQRAKLSPIVPTQTIYECADSTRRLALFVDASPPGYPNSDLYLMLNEQRLIDGKWVGDGLTVSLFGKPQKFHCNAVSKGAAISTLTPHTVDRTGNLVPIRLPVEVTPN